MHPQCLTVRNSGLAVSRMAASSMEILMCVGRFCDRSVVMRPSSMMTMSRNAADLVDHSAVNGILECILLI